MYQRLKQPPYQNWFWRRQGINGVDTTSPIDPSTLSPSEHYKEDGWVSNVWQEASDGANRSFDSESGTITSITKNSLACRESANGSLFTLSAPLRPSATWLEADDYITMYFVHRWDGGITDTILQWFGATANQEFYIRMTTGNRVAIQMYDEFSNLCNLYASRVFSAGWQVWGIRIQNLANDAKLSLFEKQVETPYEAVQTTWTQMGLENTSATNRIFSNNALTEKWDGAIAEMIIFRDNHTDNTMLRVNQFLQNKWDIT